MWKNFPICEKCEPCKPCPELPTVGNFLEKSTARYEEKTFEQPEDTPQEKQRKRSCRLDQDSKNIFSTFFKHQCKKTPYTNF